MLSRRRAQQGYLTLHGEPQMLPPLSPTQAGLCCCSRTVWTFSEFQSEVSIKKSLIKSPPSPLFGPDKSAKYDKLSPRIKRRKNKPWADESGTVGRHHSGAQSETVQTPRFSRCVPALTTELQKRLTRSLCRTTEKTRRALEIP